MKEHTQKIAQLFGCDAQITPSSYCEIFKVLNVSIISS